MNHSLQKIVLAASCLLTGCQTVTTIVPDSDPTEDIVPTTGGWAVNSGSLAMKNWPEAEAAFAKLEQPVDGMVYEAISLLGTQIVAGTNYSILARGTSEAGDKTVFSILVLYADLEGNVEVTRSHPLMEGDASFSVNAGDVDLDDHPDAVAAFDQVKSELGDGEVVSVAYLGSQDALERCYVILVRISAVTDSAAPEFVLVTVGEDVVGHAKIVDQQTLNLGM